MAPPTRITIGAGNWLLVLTNAAAVVAHAAYALATRASLPDPYPIHFGAGGQPDRWIAADSPEWLLLPVIAAGTAGFMVLLAVLMPRIPIRLWNMPHKDRLMAAPRAARERVVRTTVAMLLVLSLLNTVLMVWVQWMMVRAAQAGALQGAGELALLMFVYLGVIAGWIIHLYRITGRLPEPS
jgi:uncharacterized membrane protein